jgi:hypothetical protein
LILGAFRQKIRGVEVDLEGGMVKVVLGEDWDFETKNRSLWYECKTTFKDKKNTLIKENKDLFKNLCKKLKKQSYEVKKIKNDIYIKVKPIND